MDVHLACELTDPMAAWSTPALWLVAEGLDRVELAGQLAGVHELVYIRACAILAGRWGLAWVLTDPAAYEEDGLTLLRLLVTERDRR